MILSPVSCSHGHIRFKLRFSGAY